MHTPRLEEMNNLFLHSEKWDWFLNPGRQTPVAYMSPCYVIKAKMMMFILVEVMAVMDTVIRNNNQNITQPWSSHHAKWFTYYFISSWQLFMDISTLSFYLKDPSFRVVLQLNNLLSVLYLETVPRGDSSIQHWCLRSYLLAWQPPYFIGGEVEAQKGSSLHPLFQSQPV